MSSPVQTQNGEPSITALVSGIINDGQELLKQQLALFKSEVHTDFVKAREAAVTLALGLSIFSLGGLVLAFMAAHLLVWAYDLPVWAGYGIVGGVLVVVGLIIWAIGRRQFDGLNPVPEQTVKSVKENVQWLKNPK